MIAIFSAISLREQINFQRDDDDVGLVQDQHAKSVFFINN
jgi:hypothetical protein